MKPTWGFLHLIDAMHEIKVDPPPSRKAAVDDTRVGAQCVPVRELRAGNRCPVCKRGILDYNSLLNLACPACGFAAGGSFT